MISNKLFAILFVAVILNLLQFIYSGFTKIPKFNTKVETLQKKTGNLLQGNFGTLLAKAGMVGVILLEIVGSFILIYGVYLLRKDPNLINTPMFKKLVILTLLLFMAFIVVATVIYHPPGEKKMIPFMSNVSTLGGFGFLLYIFLQ
tara:strand:+ start:3445 stop:3882 length:438 start_codon:yes stop_codon:yes gene_type:complete